MQTMKQLIIISILGLMTLSINAKEYILKSPDNQLVINITTGSKITYSVTHNDQPIISPSSVSMELSSGMQWGNNSKVRRTKTQSVDEHIPVPFHFSNSVHNKYNELTIEFHNDWGLRFRAFNDGIAYRFFYTGKKPVEIKSEQVQFNFPGDQKAWVPYVINRSGGNTETLEQQFHRSFENTYEHLSLSQLNPDRLIFLPMVVEAGNGKKLCITEADLESYPGLYLIRGKNSNSLEGILPAYPSSTRFGGHRDIQEIVTQRESFIARVDGAREFPWRMAVVSTNDAQLAVNDMVMRLASANRLSSTDWIKPGKVAWDWWNNWNIYGVDFKAGINNKTYEYYIDFASEQGIEYVILDEGWSVTEEVNLMSVVPEIDIAHLIDYAAQRKVGIILWAGYRSFNKDMEAVCSHYASLGVKGFKVDFMDRDDQVMVDFIYRAAETAARHKLILDFHGMYKPTGIQLTYPNVMNFEGVFGLEQLKWSPASVDMVSYDVTMPFIRMLAGPVDYTQGAMKNAAKGKYHPVNSDPMSQGTRCRQLAMYVVFNSPITMLCDSPTEYKKEPESTAFIAGIPVTWDESVALEGTIGEEISIARRKGSDWYVGGMTNWTEREKTIGFDYLEKGKKYHLTLYKDGVNAYKKGIDYSIEESEITSASTLKLVMAPGGGFAMKLTPLE